MSNEQSTKGRNANMELLRVISMLMVTMLHALGKSNLLLPMEGALPVNGWIAWVLEAMSIGAVNIFMLISGYFLIRSEFKWKRLAELTCQTCFYALGAFLVFLIAGGLQSEEKDIYHLLHYVLPIHMNLYWFITAYVVIYMALPLMASGAKALTEKQLRGVILGLLTFECLFKSFLPFVLEVDSKGYSFTWYLTMFLVGAYFRLYGFHVLTSSMRGWIAYLAGCLLVLAERFLLGMIYAKTGRLDEILGVSTDYNHISVVIMSVGIFAAFLHAKQIQGIWSKLICAIAPFSLGVYLFQENLTLRYRWQKFFGLVDSLELSTGAFLIRLIGAVLAVYVAGTVVDFLRYLIFCGITKVINKRQGDLSC